MAKRLIDLAEIRNAFNDEYKMTIKIIQDGDADLDNLAEGFLEAAGILDQLSVPIVSCTNCKHYEKVAYVTSGGICNYWDCGDSEYPNTVKPDDFCSYGERKEG